MTDYKYLFLAFVELCADKHGATFSDEDIDTLHIDGKPATKTLIKQIETLAQELADEESSSTS
tara:strand:- start:1102 stop:1290 length:189 start_codon:yes stop_codon:yes gene_type:complete